MSARSNERYAEVNSRMNGINGAGAGVISVLIIASDWHDRRAVIEIALIQAAVIAFNTLVINNVLLRKWGAARAEILRAAVNVATQAYVNHIAGWPLPAWFLLPYVALAFDHLGANVARAVVAVSCIGTDVVAIHDGVHWTRPLVFTAFAAYCSVASHVRFSVIRDMLVDADAQRKRLEAEIEARHHAEVELRQAQKLEAVGRLAAGVAHEINTPLQFVSDTAQFMGESLEQLLTGFDHVREGTDVEEEARAVDLEYLHENVPEATRMLADGLKRVSDIVASMKALANPERAGKVDLDLNGAVRATLTVARHEYRYVATVHEELGDVPRVRCQPGQIHQVLLNLVVNAAHAIGDAGRRNGNITVRTSREGDDVILTVTDDGPGIPPEIQSKIFEPFFTTKQVGHGTGQGLAIARALVVDQHGGKLHFDSTPGVGTTFYVRLPIDGASAEERKVA